LLGWHYRLASRCGPGTGALQLTGRPRALCVCVRHSSAMEPDRRSAGDPRPAGWCVAAAFARRPPGPSKETMAWRHAQSAAPVAHVAGRPCDSSAGGRGIGGIGSTGSPRAHWPIQYAHQRASSPTRRDTVRMAKSAAPCGVAVGGAGENQEQRQRRRRALAGVPDQQRDSRSTAKGNHGGAAGHEHARSSFLIHDRVEPLTTVLALPPARCHEGRVRGRFIRFDPDGDEWSERMRHGIARRSRSSQRRRPRAVATPLPQAWLCWTAPRRSRTCACARCVLTRWNTHGRQSRTQPSASRHFFSFRQRQRWHQWVSES
jgi:hypothetical protein